MNLYALSSIFNFLTCFSLAIFILRRAQGRLPNILLGFLALTVSFWGFGGYIATTTDSKAVAYLGWQIGHVCELFVGPVFFHFICAYTKRNYKWQIIFFYTVAIVLYGVNIFAREIFLGDLRWFFGQFYYNDVKLDKNPAYLFSYLFFYWVLLSYSFLLLVIELFYTKDPVRRNQIKYIMVGSGSGWLGAHTNFISIFRTDFYPYFNILIGVFPIIIGYAIVKHRLIDINIVIKKSIVYSTLLTFVTSFYLVGVIVVERVFQGIVGYQNIHGTIVVAVLIALLFNPLKNRIQDFVDKTFFKATTAEIAEQNDMLRRQITQSERYKTLASLTSGIVDELKNPLTALQGYSHFLEKKKDDPEFMLKYKEMQESQLAKINELLEHLTEYSNPTPLSTQMVLMTKMLNEIIGLMKSSLNENKVELVRDFKAPETIHLNVDPAQLRQALTNIIINAVEAMPKGGTLTVSTAQAEDKYRITLRDTGCGMNKEALGKVFDPFFTTKQGHSGLGLSIVQGIVENHNGKVRVHSEEGKGAEFALELPLSESSISQS